MVASDASDTSVGAVILDKFKNGKIKARAHASWTYLAADIKYNQIKKEALAINFAEKSCIAWCMAEHLFYK